MGGNGKPKGRTRLSMCMITVPSQTGKRFRMGFTMWSTTAASSMWALITRLRRLLWRVSDAGGAALGAVCIQEVKELLIVADAGGSNGARNRLWKMQLQQLATETGLSITVCHLPPATSKWNKIEHRLFSYISINWRGKPLTSFETVIELISHTTTRQGLTVTAVKDTNSYPTGIKVSDEDLASLSIVREPFHGDWNYTIQPQ